MSDEDVEMETTAAGERTAAAAGPSSSKLKRDGTVDGRDSMWIEKYRPKTLDDVAAHKEIIDTSAWLPGRGRGTRGGGRRTGWSRGVCHDLPRTPRPCLYLLYTYTHRALPGAVGVVWCWWCWPFSAPGVHLVCQPAPLSGCCWRAPLPA